MNKPCATCGKVVYPVEQIKCLDNVWHKLCFKCQTCNMLLNMKNHKGHEKKPYCFAHYPQPRGFTAVADTPENQRVAANTKTISNIAYHSEYEKSKGQYTHIPDDPETVRTKTVSSVVSNAAYANLKEKRDGQEKRRSSIDVESEAASFPARGKPGRIDDYDPNANVFDNKRSSRQSGEDDRKSSSGSTNAIIEPKKYGSSPKNYGTSPPKPDDVTFSPVVTVIPDPVPSHEPAEHDESNIQHPTRNSHIANNTMTEPEHHKVDPSEPPAGQLYRALYDYEALDGDEVSFEVGDIICKGEKIDEGWMLGEVQRTGQHGMLPSNYVEEI